MIEYEYPELFYDHETVHLIIVDSLAIVTPVENEPPEIENEDFILTEEDIETESFSLDESLCSEDNLKFGLCESARIQFSMYASTQLPSLEDKEIIVYLYFNEDSSTLFRVGNYIIEEDKLSINKDIRKITGYDYLYQLYDYDITEWYNGFYEQHGTSHISTIRNSLFTWLWQEILEYDVEQETVTLPNDSYLLEKSIESDVVTFGFFMQGIMEINGVFGHVNRDGLFSYVSLDLYDDEPAQTLNDDILIPPIQYQDWNTWGIGYVAVYDRNNNRIAKVGDSAYRHPSVYSVVNSFVFSNNERRANWKQQLETAVSNMREAVTHRRYRSCNINCLGNLCLEVGDRIDITWDVYDDDGEVTGTKTFKTYILERKFKGIQEFKDNYIAKGDKKQPKYQTGKVNDNWHVGDTVINTYDGVQQLAEIVSSDDFPEIIRNIGFRLLDEPTNVSIETNVGPEPQPEDYTVTIRTSGNGVLLQLDYGNRNTGGDMTGVTSIAILQKKSSIPQTKDDGDASELMPAYELTGYQGYLSRVEAVAYLGLNSDMTYNLRPFITKNHQIYKGTNHSIVAGSNTNSYVFEDLWLQFYGAHEAISYTNIWEGYCTNYACVLVYPNRKTINSITVYITKCTDEWTNKTVYVYVRNTPSGSNIEELTYTNTFDVSEGRTFTLTFNTPITQPRWIVFHDALNTGWIPHVQNLTFNCS